MMAFRKLSAESSGKLLAAYFTENTPDPTHDFAKDPGKVLDSGERLTSYYTGRDSRGDVATGHVGPSGEGAWD